MISAVMTGHREGVLCGPSLRSFAEAIAAARAAGLEVEPLIVLDRPDAPTIDMMQSPAAADCRVVVCDHGDPGLARNRGVQEARGDFVAFLDADDLWSFNWLTEAHALCSRSAEPVILHSEIDMIFGSDRLFLLHVDSEAPGFDPDYLRIFNYWDALSFAFRAIYLQHPYRANDLARGYGHEDWHWNCVTLAAGIPHRPVPGTVHFKRRRDQSQTSRCVQSDVVIWPNPLTRFQPEDLSR